MTHSCPACGTTLDDGQTYCYDCEMEVGEPQGEFGDSTLLLRTRTQKIVAGLGFVLLASMVLPWAHSAVMLNVSGKQTVTGMGLNYYVLEILLGGLGVLVSVALWHTRIGRPLLLFASLVAVYHVHKARSEISRYGSEVSVGIGAHLAFLVGLALVVVSIMAIQDGRESSYPD